MAGAVLSVLSTVIKCRGWCTSPLIPQSESFLDLSRSGTLQLRWEVGPWEGVVLFPDMVDQVLLHCASAQEWGCGGSVPLSQALWGLRRHRASGGCSHFIWRLGEVFEKVFFGCDENQIFVECFCSGKSLFWAIRLMNSDVFDLNKCWCSWHFWNVSAKIKSSYLTLLDLKK